MGTLRSTLPVTRWGWERGTPVDRYYIESFLNRHRADIRGRVLEVKNSDYSRRFGQEPLDAQVLDIDAANPQATIVADLAAADSIPSCSFDCFILTSTLQYILDVDSAVRHSHRILRPGGVLLVTVPAVSRIDLQASADYWRFTPAICRNWFEKHFAPEKVQVEAAGNVLSAISFLKGLAAQDLKKSELDYQDAAYPVIIAIRAVK
jgi:SAM-dependent methyltransferase